jgi:hypothetical protein
LLTPPIRPYANAGLRRSGVGVPITLTAFGETSKLRRVTLPFLFFMAPLTFETNTVEWSNSSSI